MLFVHLFSRIKSVPTFSMSKKSVIKKENLFQHLSEKRKRKTKLKCKFYSIFDAEKR